MQNSHRTLTALLFAAGAYYLLARLGLLLALDQSNASPIWPPSGFALVLLLRYGRQFWPAVLLGAFFANLAVFLNNQVASLPVVLAASCAIALGNAAEGLLGAWWLRRYGIAALALRTQREVYKFSLIIALAAVASACTGVVTLRLAGIIPADSTWQVAATWWTGDFLGLLLLAPMGMALPSRLAWPRWRLTQFAFLLALAAATLAVFLTESQRASGQLLPYGLLLFIGLAAVRRWRSVIRVALAIITGIAIPATVLDQGPFVSGVLHHSLLSLCTFLAISTLLAWVLATEEDQGAAEKYAWTPILTLLVCMALTMGAWSWITRDAEMRTRERFQRAADEVRETIRIRIDAYQSLLRAGTALHDASQSVERDEWRRFVEGLNLPAMYPGVQGLGFARFIPGGAENAALDEIRRSGAPDFNMWPAGSRDMYTPIVYLEPRSKRNLHAIGYDMMSEPTRRQAIVMAMQSASMAASGPIILVQEISGPVQVGFLMFNPVYGQGHAGLPELKGFVYSPFRMEDLMRGIFGDRLRDVRLEIHFLQPQGELLYSSARHGVGKSYLRLASEQRVSVGANGQEWVLQVSPTAEFDATVDQDKPFLILVMGTLISLLFFGVSRTLVQQRSAARQAQVRSQASLEVSEARFKLLTSHIRNHAIVLLDAAGTISTWNEGAEKLFGYQDSDIVGHPVGALQADRDGRESLERALRHGQDESTALRRRKDGSTFLALTQIFPVRDDGGKCIGYAMILRDVTAEKAAEKELNDAKTQAESASAAKSAFVANISHELRTPMNAVLGLAQLLGRTRLNPEQRQYLDMVAGAGKSLLALLNDVLDFSKIEANKLELSDVDFLLDEVHDALAAVMGVSAAEKGLSLSLCVERDVPVCLHGDVQRIQQILLNLLSNALKFTERGTVSVRACRDKAEPYLLRWEVSDTGIGMTEEQLQRLFSPFTQADASMARRYGGTGLGLAISQRLAQIMGGKIEVSSHTGRGTTFVFSVPLAAGAKPDAYLWPAERASWRILYADPNHRLHGDVVELAARWHWQCDTVTSAAELREAVAGKAYDLLIYDASLEAAGRQVQQLAKRICLRTVADAGASAGGDLELLRPLTRSALFNALAQAPAAPPAAALPAAGKEPDQQAFTGGRQALAGLRVLLAEDNALNQLVARSMLEAVGAEVHIAADGAQAVDFLRRGEHPVDIVLMDVQMPVMDGFAATQHIRRELGMDVPVLAMSAGVTLAERAQCQAAGMDDFVAKPVDGDDLVATILRHIHAKQRN